MSTDLILADATIAVTLSNTLITAGLASPRFTAIRIESLLQREDEDGGRVRG